MDLHPNELAFRPDLLAAGYTDDELRTARRRGEIVAVRRGAYVDAADERLADPGDRHAPAARATAARLGPDTVVSHVSAAALLGLRIWGAPLDRVHVTRDARSGVRRGRQLHVHAAPLGADDVVTVDGLLVTSPARTVCDVARSAGFVAGVVVGDAALEAGLVDRPRLQAVAAAARGRSGCADARRVAAFADPGGCSVGESRSRILIARAGLPPPLLQHPVYDDRGALVGRTDFAWPELRTVGEVDGMTKYGRLLRPGQSAADAVVAEKLREDGCSAPSPVGEPSAHPPGIRAPCSTRVSVDGARTRVAYRGRP